MGKKALVLGGGGTKGAYQLGVWRALHELGEKFDIITGSSIGAINGALMAQDAFELADKLWNSIEYDNIFPDEQQRKRDISAIDSMLDMIKFAVNDALLQGSADSSSLEALLTETIDEDIIRSSGIEFGLVAVELPSMRPFTPMISQIPHGMLCRYLMASAACFPVFSPYEIEGIRYIDGGYHDNVPINLAIAQGADDIVAVDLEAVGLVKEPKRADAIMIRRIHSYWDLGTMFAFDKNIYSRNRTLGYYDTMKAYGKLDGFYYTFEKGACARNYASKREGAKILETRIAVMAKSHLAKTINAVEKDEAINYLMTKKCSLVDKLCRSAEIAGLVYGLSPEPIYSFSHFDEQLIHFYQVIPQVFPSIELNPKEDIKRVLAAVLQSMEPRSMSAAITQLMLKEEAAEAIGILARLLPREYTAACYIALLMKAR